MKGLFFYINIKETTVISFDGCFVNDNELNTYIVLYLNERLCRCVKDEYVVALDQYLLADEEPSKQMEFAIEYLSDFFPSNYERSKVIPSILELIRILESDGYFLLRIELNYALARIIEFVCDCYPDEKIKSIPVDVRKKVRNQLIRDYKVDDLNKRDFEEEAERTIALIENMENYTDICFADCDYELLDSMDKDSLEKFLIDKRMGPLNIHDNEVLTNSHYIINL